MKKIILLAIIGLCVHGIRANILVPKAYISEIHVDSSGIWTIEIGLFTIDIPEIDSVRLVTSTGSSIISELNISFGVGNTFDALAVITVANLANPVEINSSGDFVRLTSYVWGYEYWDEIAFGNYPGSYLTCLNPSESVTVTNTMQFCITSVPTIGEECQPYHCVGDYSGIILDPSGNPLTNGYIHVELNFYSYLNLYPDEQGHFSKEMLARTYKFDTIIHHYPPYTESTIYQVEHTDFCLYPDSSYYQNIVATDIINGYSDIESTKQFIITVAPNPFSDHVVFYFNMNNNDDQNLHFSIYSLEGKMITQFPVSPGQKGLDWRPSGDVTRGTYIYRLENGIEILKTGKFIKL
jgi:hypothetical protein